MPRLIDSKLERSLEALGAALVFGPKGCGKTTTASRLTRSAARMREPGERERNMALAGVKPSRLLIGDNPRLIDEWQAAPMLWDAVRRSVDIRGDASLYVLTGSTRVNEDRIMHSGAGRIARLQMGTMSLFESGDSDGSVSLAGLFDGRSEISGASKMELEDAARLIVRGGWPQAVGKSEPACRRIVRERCEDMVGVELAELDEKRRDPKRARAVMASLSRRASAPMSKAWIMKDMSENGMDISENTLNGYLDALRDICVLDETPAWRPGLRSKAKPRAADEIHFCDPSVAAFFLGATGDGLMDDAETFRRLFKSMAVRDLREYARYGDGDVFHYRDSSGLEIDAVIRLRNDRWGAAATMLGWNADGCAERLLKLKRIVNARIGEPAFLAIITASGYAYTRRDGVHVIPIGCLGP
jgi:predicted AAA+ superfamily ATPase